MDFIHFLDCLKMDVFFEKLHKSYLNVHRKVAVGERRVHKKNRRHTWHGVELFIKFSPLSRSIHVVTVNGGFLPEFLGHQKLFKYLLPMYSNYYSRIVTGDSSKEVLHRNHAT